MVFRLQIEVPSHHVYEMLSEAMGTRGRSPDDIKAMVASHLDGDTTVAENASTGSGDAPKLPNNIDGSDTKVEATTVADSYLK